MYQFYSSKDHQEENSVCPIAMLFSRLHVFQYSLLSIWILNSQITWRRCVAYSPFLIPLHALPHRQLPFHTVATTSAFFLPQIRTYCLIFLQYTTHVKLLYGFISLAVWGYLKVIRAQSREEPNAEYQMLYSRAMAVLCPGTFLTGAIQVQG